MFPIGSFAGGAVLRIAIAILQRPTTSRNSCLHLIPNAIARLGPLPISRVPKLLINTPPLSVVRIMLINPPLLRQVYIAPCPASPSTPPTFLPPPHLTHKFEKTSHNTKHCLYGWSNIACVLGVQTPSRNTSKAPPARHERDLRVAHVSGATLARGKLPKYRSRLPLKSLSR